MSKSKTLNELSPGPEGCLIIFSAPSGCGKTTIIDRLLKRHSNWVRSISATTRSPREGEKEGEDYFFLSSEKFRQMEKEGGLLESAKVFDQYYGTPKQFIFEQLKKDKKVLLAVDIQGAEKIKRVLVGKVLLQTIFVLPPSVKVLRERLESRQTESAEQMELRIQMAQNEIKEAGKYDFTVVNQNLDQTVAEIENFIEKNKHK